VHLKHELVEVDAALPGQKGREAGERGLKAGVEVDAALPGQKVREIGDRGGKQAKEG
jgi:hypothetical protein